jgi:hypothetical protein
VTRSSPVGGPLLFHPLTIHDDGDEVVVAREGAETYDVFPADGAALLSRLRQGATPAEAATWYQGCYGEPVDMAEFVEALHVLGYVRTGPVEPVEGTRTPLAWQRLGRTVFSLPAVIACVCVMAVAVVACALDPRMVPTHDDVFFTRSLLLIEVTVLVGQLPLTVIHELAHFLAGRRIGVPSRIRVAHRFTVVVFETVLDGLVMLPRRQRYLPMLAGILADLVVMGALVDIAWILRSFSGGGGIAPTVCLALAFTTLPRILWQFFVFLRTDVYYLLATALRCDDLDGAGRDALRNWFWGRRKRPDRVIAAERWSNRDWRAGRAFAPVLVAGYAAMIATLAGLVGPLALQFVERALDSLQGGGPWRWDAIAVLALNLAQPVAARMLAWKARGDAPRLSSRAQPLGS